MRWEKPFRGSMAWGGDAAAADGEPGLWRSLRFNRGVGLVHAGLTLVPGRTVLEHLALFCCYNLDAPLEGIRAKAEGLMRELGIRRDGHAGDLGRRDARLALYALALVKDPWLYVLERPARHLGRDFARVWGLVAARCASGGAAALALDTSPEGYAGAGFLKTVPLGPDGEEDD
jgi:ABC-type multidrug transport system ATPase subunit